MPWTVAFEQGPAQAIARIDRKEVAVTFAALLSLWAVARASLTIAVEAEAATRAGLRELDARPGTAVAEAYALVEAAKSLIRGPSASWPADIPDGSPSLLSPALELSAHVLKACVFPHDAIDAYETPQDTFFGTLLMASRLPAAR